jgi:glycosyltransferase involved in cell wall biosynthesis
MKLLIDLQGAQTDSRHRGIGRQARASAIGLIEAAGDHDVHILLNAGLKDSFDELRREFLKILPADHIKTFAIPGAVRELDGANLWRMRVTELTREAAIADLRPDILYITSLFEGVVDDAVTSIGLMQAPYATAVTLHDVIPLVDPKQYLAADFMRNFYYRRLQSLKRADQLIAVSEYARREAMEMLQIPGDRIDVSLNAADQSFRRVNLSEFDAANLRRRYGVPESYIFYVGAIEPRKNIPFIIEAFGKLSAAQRGSTALVFGGRLSEPERLQLQTAAVRFGLDPSRLILPGFIAEADLAALYTLCSLFVFPSLHEGFGLPPLEAMACGAPVLVARNSSLPEVVGREDQLFDTCDSSELSAKMARVLTEAAYASELRAWGVGRASQFSWAQAGRQTLASLEKLHDRHRQSQRAQLPFGARPRLAFVSPLPSDRSGIANYASELLRELGCYYEIECIIHESVVTDPWILANFPLRDVTYFRDNADQYDYILYQIGNSEFHAHMLDLLIEIPGVVILHDFFLSGLLDWLGNVGRRSKAYFLRQLYLTHGLPALAYVAEEGRHAAAERYPANQAVFANAQGVIAHSRWSIERAKEIYGDAAPAKMVHIPHLRAVRPTMAKSEARRQLGIDPDAFVVSTFGFVAETKCGDRLVEAWALSAAGRAERASLIFVGDHPLGPWGDEFRELTEGLSDGLSIEVTGYADTATYECHLAAADIAVQLRRNTRGETSGAILDCMAAGLPLIVNAHGTAAEISSEAVLSLPDVFTTQELADAIDRLFIETGYRTALGTRAQDELLRHHHPAVVGHSMRDALEHFTINSDEGRQKRLIGAIGALFAPVSPDDADLVRLAETIAKSKGRFGPRRIFYDITLLAESDAHTGIERVVRSFLSHLLRQVPDGYMVEPVRFEHGRLVFARRYIAEKFEIPADVLPDAPIDYDAGDIYLMLEWAAGILPGMEDYLQDFRRSGGRVVIGIYDLLPLQLPHRFPDYIPGVAQLWFKAALTLADQFICISRCVADDVLKFGNALVEPRPTPIKVDYFTLGADISASLPTKGMSEEANALLERLQREATFIMVGTVEPRKGHQLIIDAFHLLWDRGVDANLVIVGRQGWSVETVVRSIDSSRERGKRLYWLQGVSDEYLERLYESSTALIAASEGEGFGLPLIEGAARGLPLIARDIPVFHEVAGENAYYFGGNMGREVADAISQWLIMNEAGSAPSSAGLKPLRWEQSVEQFQQAMFGESSYGTILEEGVR